MQGKVEKSEQTAHENARYCVKSLSKEKKGGKAAKKRGSQIQPAATPSYFPFSRSPTLSHIHQFLRPPASRLLPFAEVPRDALVMRPGDGEKTVSTEQRVLDRMGGLRVDGG